MGPRRSTKARRIAILINRTHRIVGVASRLWVTAIVYGGSMYLSSLGTTYWWDISVGPSNLRACVGNLPWLSNEPNQTAECITGPPANGNQAIQVPVYGVYYSNNFTDRSTRMSASMRHNDLIRLTSKGAMLMLVVFSFGTPVAAHCPSDFTTAGYQPKTMYAFMTKGTTEAQAGNESGADQTWRAAYEFYKDHCSIPEWAANLVPLVKAGKVQQAFQLFDQDYLMPMYWDVGADKPYYKASAAAKHGDFDTAVRGFQEALEISAKSLGQSRFPEADFMLGMALYGQGKRAEAVRQWRVTLSDSWPAVPEADVSGPDAIWLAALQLYATREARSAN